MFVVAVVSLLSTLLLLKDVATSNPDASFSFQIVLWLWFTVLFANFAEAVAEGRGKAQADSCAAHEQKRRPNFWIVRKAKAGRMYRGPV